MPLVRFLLALLLGAMLPFPAQAAPLPPLTLASGLQFPEGPSLSPDGKTLYVVNVQSRFISRIDLRTKTLTREWVALPTGGRPNGSRIGPDGALYITDVGRKLIARVALPDGKITTIADKTETGGAFRGPNDLFFDKRGGIYFSDPDGTWGEPIAAVYYLAPKTYAVSKVAEGLQFPNGLALSPDEKTLYVAESPLHRITAISLPSGAKRVFCVTGTVGGDDGMRVDKQGFLYAAIFGEGFVAKISPQGQIVGRYPTVVGPNPTDLCFSRDGQSLYVTEQQTNSVLQVPLTSSATGKRLPHQQRPDFLPLGIYWPGEATFRDAPTPAERWRKIDGALAGMAAHHINAVWIVNENTDWAAELARHAARYGIYIVAATNQLEGKTDWIRRGDHAKLIAQTMQDWGDAPRPIAWGLSDEAPLDIMPEMAAYAADWRKYAPDEPITIVEPWKNIAAAGKLPWTALAHDDYVFFSPGNPLGYNLGGDWIPWELTMQHVAALRPRPWAMGQAYQEPMGPYDIDSRGNLVYLPGSFPHWVMPTPAQISWQAWSAFALGARGMFYFVFAEPDSPHLQNTIPAAFAQMTFPALVNAPTDSHSPRGLTYPDGRPTPQYAAVGAVFGKLTRLAPTLAPLTLSPLREAWLASSPEGGAIASVLADRKTGKRYLMAVAPYTGKGPQTVRVLLGPHILGLTDTLTGRKIAVTGAGRLHQAILSLPPGEGTLLACTLDRSNLPAGYADDFSTDKYLREAWGITPGVQRQETGVGFSLSATGAGASLVYDTARLIGPLPAGGLRLLTWQGQPGVSWWISDDAEGWHPLSADKFDQPVPFTARYLRADVAHGLLLNFSVTQWKHPASLNLLRKSLD